MRALIGVGISFSSRCPVKLHTSRSRRLLHDPCFIRPLATGDNSVWSMHNAPSLRVLVLIFTLLFSAFSDFAAEQ